MPAEIRPQAHESRSKSGGMAAEPTLLQDCGEVWSDEEGREEGEIKEGNARTDQTKRETSEREVVM